MFGRPFYSAGAVRVVGSDRYHYRHVSFAHWATLYGLNGYIELKKNRRKFRTFRSHEELEAFFKSLPEEKQ